jgi:hypothetical protein
MLASNRYPAMQLAREPGLLSRKLLWIGAALAIICGAIWQFYPLGSPGRDRLAGIPLSGSGFRGWDVPLTATEQTVLGRVDLVNRRYWWGHRRLFVSVVDGSNDRHAVHDPRYCFQGAGWRLVAQRSLALPGGDGTLLRLGRGADQFQVLYWFSEGDRRYSSFPRYWWRATLRRLTLGRHGAEPLLVVVQDLDAGVQTPPLPAAALIESLRL